MPTKGQNRISNIVKALRLLMIQFLRRKASVRLASAGKSDKDILETRLLD